MANDRDYNPDEGQRGEPAREDERGEGSKDSEREIRTSDRGVERSDWSDADVSEESKEPSEEGSAEPDDLESNA